MLLEHYSRLVILARLPGKDAEAVVDTLIEQARRLPREKSQTMKHQRNDSSNVLHRSVKSAILQQYEESGTPSIWRLRFGG